MKLLLALALIVVVAGGCSSGECNELYEVYAVTDGKAHWSLVFNGQHKIMRCRSTIAVFETYQEARAECDRLNKEAGE